MFSRQYQCPLLPPDQRPKKPNYKKNLDQSTLSQGSGSSSGINSQQCDIDTSKPKGLLDSLSRYFTPSDKRQSRVSVLSRQPVLIQANVKRKEQSYSRKTAKRLLKKSCLVQIEKGKKNVEKPANSTDGLFDGLSHLYTTQGVRKKELPLYSLNYKRFHKDSSHVGKSLLKRPKGKGEVRVGQGSSISDSSSKASRAPYKGKPCETYPHLKNTGKYRHVHLLNSITSLTPLLY
jgi:hypothetical protein